MKGIEKITARIAAEAEAANDVVRAESASRIAEIRAEYDKKAQEEADAILRTGEKEAQQLASRVERNAQLEAKRQLLAVKQDMVSQAFELAKSKFAQLPQAEYVAYLQRQIQSACTGDAVLVLNAADKAKYGMQLELLVNPMIKGKGSITVAEETGDMIGGFILKQGDVEVNGTIDILLEMVRGELAAQVAQVLFEG